MKKLRKKLPNEKVAARVNRSISFPLSLHEFVTQRAKLERRSFNWIVNDLIEKELDRAD